MKEKCPVCGKGFWCDYPHLWAYKREKLFLCSWKCIREYDRKEAEEMAYRKIRKDGTPAKPTGKKAAQALQELKEDFAEKGVELVYDPGIAEEYRREQAQKESNARAKAEAEKPEVVLTIRTEDLQEFEYRVTGIDTEVGNFQYFRRNGYLDWTDLNGTTVSMTVEEWKTLIRIWPKVVKVLKVEV